MDAETPDKEYGYTIDGEIYPEPENLTVDDHRIVKRYTGFNFLELASMGDAVMYIDQDGIAAVMHISYRHRHPEMSFDQIAEIIGRQDLRAAQEMLETAAERKERQEAEEEKAPLGLTSPRDESSPSEPTSKPSEPDSNKQNSGDDSKKSSDPSDEKPGTTGTSGSDTSSPQSDRETTEALAS